MLAIGVHDDDGVTPRRQQARQDRRLVAEVSREAQPAHRAMRRLQGLDLSPRAVGAAVIDDHDLEVATRRLPT